MISYEKCSYKKHKSKKYFYKKLKLSSSFFYKIAPGLSNIVSTFKWYSKTNVITKHQIY